MLKLPAPYTARFMRDFRAGIVGSAGSDMHMPVDYAGNGPNGPPVGKVGLVLVGSHGPRPIVGET